MRYPDATDVYEIVARWYWATTPKALAKELGEKWTPESVRKYARYIGVDVPGWPGYIRLRVAARVIGGSELSRAAARVIWRLARRDGVLVHAAEGVPLVPVPWVWEVEPEVLEGVFRYNPRMLDPVPMRDDEVRGLIARYLQRTGDAAGAEALWQAHVAWRRAHGLPPAGEVSRAGGGGGPLPRDRDLGGRGHRRR